jgi:solute carrier family 10 (sodium/bile acid cotransporter), member 7
MNIGREIRTRLDIDPFILLLLGTVALASIVPARGVFAAFAGGLADAGIVLLFFLHGAKLSRQAILDGARNWRLHLAVLGITFVCFPALGIGASHLPGIAEGLAAGLLFLTLLPSTVQSSIAFVAIARGNVAAAVCSASFSNLAGIVITPLLAALLLGGSGAGVSAGAFEAILLQLLAPFLAGHMLRPWIGGWVERHKPLTSLVDRGSILLVVYAAFGAAVADGLWSKVSWGELVLIAGLSLTLLALVLGATHALGKALDFSREDRIVLLFCGSKKSLATGVPMAGVLFAPTDVGAIILPLLFFHQIQLIVCAVLARRLAARPGPENTSPQR